MLVTGLTYLHTYINTYLLSRAAIRSQNGDRTGDRASDRTGLSISFGISIKSELCDLQYILIHNISINPDLNGSHLDFDRSNMYSFIICESIRIGTDQSGLERIASGET